MESLSAYTIARNCTDIADLTCGIDEIKEAMQIWLQSGKKIPSYYYTRLFHLKKKLAKFEYQESKKVNSQKISEKIVELSSKLAEYSLMAQHRVSQDTLFDENGNYHAQYQDEFCSLYDEYYDDLITLCG